MDALGVLLEDMRERLIDLVQLAGPWGSIAVTLAVLLLVIGRRYHLISVPGIVLLLAFALFAFTLRALHLGKF